MGLGPRHPGITFDAEAMSTDGQTLGFALVKGLVKGLTRCPDPPLRFHSTTHFWMNVGESVLCLTVDTSHALDPVHMGVVGGVILRRGSASLLRRPLLTCGLCGRSRQLR